MNLEFEDRQVAARIAEWGSAPYDEATRAEVAGLVAAGNKEELLDRFYRTLEFGTGGLRGKLGAGTNRMNAYVVARATQGLATYVKEHRDRGGPLRAAVTHDCRIRSREFAEVTASVFAANGFHVFISPDLRPTPYLSFAVRELGCHTGVVVTASHNPKEYNGYKAYWGDGSQVVPPHDGGIITEVDRVVSDAMVQRVDYAEAVADGRITVLGPEMDDAFLAAVLTQRLHPGIIAAHAPRIAYTPLHGVGGTLVPRALAMWGFTDVVCEPAQMIPDGTFPTAASPNPEEAPALNVVLEFARQQGAELVLATDPDADRVGVAVLHHGEFVRLSGNQVSTLMADYLVREVKAAGTVQGTIGMGSTIVTSPLVPRVVEAEGGVCPLVLTGFKWIADVARRWENTPGSPTFVMGTEESIGYTVGRYCRDKDGIAATCVVGEMAAVARSKGRTLVDELMVIYQRFGPHHEWQRSITLPGISGAEQIKGILASIKSSPPAEIGGRAVVRRVDYSEGIAHEADGSTTPTGLPLSTVFQFDLADGSRAIARPSGTEPKIKFYFFLCDPQSKGLPLDAIATATARLRASAPAFEKAFFDAIGYTQ